eukprot:11219840-Lingulodinium_polyedra.AAC.1
MLTEVPTSAAGNASPTDWPQADPLPQAYLDTVTYVDDLTACASDAVPAVLLEKAKALTLTVHRALVSHGLRPNYSQGKT